MTVSGLSRGSISNSSIIDNVYVGKGGTLDDELMIRTLIKIADTDRTPILMPFMDRDVDMVLRYRDELEQAGYVIPLAPTEVVEKASDKALLNEICESLGLPTITTSEILLSTPDDAWGPALDAITFPAVIKPKDGGMDYGRLRFEGQRKAYSVETRGEALETLLSLIHI